MRLFIVFFFAFFLKINKPSIETYLRKSEMVSSDWTHLVTGRLLYKNKG